MSTSWLQVAGVAGGFLLVFVAGFWLSHSGRPYGTGLLTMHKVVSVGILIFLGVNAYGGVTRTPAHDALVWLVVSLVVLAFVATIASGGVLGAVESPPAAVSLLHKVAPYATVLLPAVAFYYLLWGGA